MRKRIFAVSLVLGATALVGASESVVQAQTGQQGETSKLINVLRIDKAGAAFVAVQNPSASAACAFSVLALGNVSNEATRAMYALLLAAKVNRAPVSLSFTNCGVDAVNF